VAAVARQLYHWGLQQARERHRRTGRYYMIESGNYDKYPGFDTGSGTVKGSAKRSRNVERHHCLHLTNFIVRIKGGVLFR
jgi:hypothetical protein